MLTQKTKTIIAVHNDEVCWIENSAAGRSRQVYLQPLDQVLSNENASLEMPDWLKGHHKTLCIIPDHWFGSQSYPFRSTKTSLIEPFLERKLKASHPGHEAIKYFYNYRHIGDDREPNLDTLFLQDEKSFQLYHVLCRMNHAPQHITSPAFLWEERLRHAESDFDRLGTLLIHLTEKECQLYFYFKGKYQFSRSVMLFETGDDVDALGFEINQSLYMFSQKAKSDLDRIYMLCEAPQCRLDLSEVLGREIIGLEALTRQHTEEAVAPEMVTLIGLLHASRLGSGMRFFNVMHRQVRQLLEWRPVQWAGIFIGLVLVLGLLGEHVALRNMLAAARHTYQSTQHHAAQTITGPTLSEYPATLDQVLSSARRSLHIGTAHRMPAGFPNRIQLKTLELDLMSQPTMKVTAQVQAQNADQLQDMLGQLIVKMAERFNGARTLSLNDIDISLTHSNGMQSLNRYLISFALELS